MREGPSLWHRPGCVTLLFESSSKVWTYLLDHLLETKYLYEISTLKSILQKDVDNLSFNSFSSLSRSFWSDFLQEAPGPCRNHIVSTDRCRIVRVPVEVQRVLRCKVLWDLSFVLQCLSQDHLILSFFTKSYRTWVTNMCSTAREESSSVNLVNDWGLERNVQH